MVTMITTFQVILNRKSNDHLTFSDNVVFQKSILVLIFFSEILGRCDKQKEKCEECETIPNQVYEGSTEFQRYE